MYYLTNVNLIIRQGVTDDVELEHAESLGKLLHSQGIAYKKHLGFLNVVPNASVTTTKYNHILFIL